MARLPALIDALTEIDGRDRLTLDVIARLLSESGLLSKIGNRVDTASMTSRCAANLLIAANAVQAPESAALAVQQYRTFKQSSRGRSIKGNVLGKISDCDTLGEAMQVLVEQARAIEAGLVSWAYGAYRDYKPTGFSIEDVIFLTSELVVGFSSGAVTIEIAVIELGMRSVQFEWTFHEDATLMCSRFYTYPGRGPDRRVTTTIGLRTLLAMHDALIE